jgi:4-amino-4-deoxy-L-arabinose transferase-like glycosyltransferase
LGKEPYTPYSFLATGHATFYFYILLASLKIGGTNLLALRLPAAIFGILNPVLLYFVLKRVFKSSFFLPFILTVVFITMRWYFNFARFGFEATFLLFLELISLLFMLKYADKKKLLFAGLSGLFAGLAYNSYQPGRIFFIIPLLTLLIFESKKRIKPYVYFAIPFMCLILPLTIYLNIHKDIRFYQQFYPDNHEMTLQEKGDFFLRNFTSIIGIFNIKGDVNGRHNYPNKPALNPIQGALFLTGLTLALIGIKHTYNQIFLVWFIISLAPSLVTYPWENPNMLRTFTAIPSVVYFAGLTIQYVGNLKLSHRPLMGKVFLTALTALILISSLYEIRTYFVHQAEVFKEAFEAQKDITDYLK